MNRYCVYMLAGAAFALFAIGCGPGLIKVRGKVVVNGASVPTDRKLDVIFYPYLESGPPDEFYPATSKPGGLFHVSGKGGKGIPPGKYRISVTGATTRENRESIDPKISNFASPIIREITTDEELLVDLAKPTG